MNKLKLSIDKLHKKMMQCKNPVQRYEIERKLRKKVKKLQRKQKEEKVR